MKLKLAIAALCFPATVAAAADMRAPLPQPAPLPPAEFTAGWYLRGDLGYLVPNDPATQAYGGTNIRFDHERIGKTGNFGAGVGIRFNNWLRVDVAGSYSGEARFSGSTSQSNYVNGYSPDTARFRFGTLLANGYVDLGTWSGLTPYLGAGVGVASVEVTNYRSQTFLFPPSPDYPVGAVGPALVASGTIPGKTATNFAWALMAGVAVEITPQLSLDVGYRYLDLGKSATSLDAFGIGARFETIKAQELRAGLRYSFGASL